MNSLMTSPDSAAGGALSMPVPANASPARLARRAAFAAEEKLGRDTAIIDVGEALSITDFFVITSAVNDRQVRSIVDEVERHLTEVEGVKPLRVEGLDHLGWVLMDYGSFVVHVFDEATRAFYDLERLWRSLPRLALVEPT